MSEWVIEEGVRCVVCPGCAFTFGADHTDMMTGFYTCPECQSTSAPPCPSCGMHRAIRPLNRCNDPFHDGPTPHAP